jgi:hypothetical protein
VVEARLIRAHEPPYNRRGRTWRRYAYLRIDTNEAFPRIKVVRDPRADGVVLGPFSSSHHARLAKEALEEAAPIRRCTTRMRASTRFAPCALAEIGRCTAPCDGRIDPERYGELVRSLVSSLAEPGGLLETLGLRLRRLSDERRYEEAAVARDRLRALAEALWRFRMDAWLLAPADLVLRDRDGTRIRLREGALARDGEGALARDGDEALGVASSRERADELAALRAWVARHPMRIESTDRPLAEPIGGGAALRAVLDRLREAGRDGARALGG